MRVRSFVMVAAAVLLLGGGTALAQAPAGAPYVFVSNPDAGQIVKVVSSTSSTVVFEQRKLAVQGMVVGPDDKLYACAPDAGLVFKFDPNTPPDGGYPYTRATVETVYLRAAGGPQYPQCGWFSDKGDLFLTDRASPTAVWEYSNLVALSPDADPPALITRVPSSAVGAGFNGQGVTQAASGDLLFADKNGGIIYSLPFDPIFRFQSPMSSGVGTVVTGIGSPVGIARSGNGTLFYATGTEVRSFGGHPCSTLTFNGQSPQFLQFTADDVLYVASTSKQAATLWRVNYASTSTTGSCSAPAAIITFERPTWVPGMSGVALPRTSRDGIEADPPAGVTADFYFSFKDHAYEVDVTGCTPGVTASETPPDCLAHLISNYLFADPNDPGELTQSGVPVTYAGDDGVAQLYHVTRGADACTTNPTHAISAYTALVKNPRIIRCGWTPFDPDTTTPPPTDPIDACNPPSSSPSPDYFFGCQMISLDSFFPFNGVFPDDGRIAGSATTTDFSDYFFADITLSGSGAGFDNAAGCFCGWESPLPNIYMLDPDDPFFGLPSYNSGSSVPLKFRVAALGPDQTCETSDPCASSPYGYVTGGQVLLSVAKVFDGSGLGVFVPIRPESTSASVPGILFGNPNSPSTPYHYNLDTTGYEPGVYQAVAVALTDNFAVEWTYFAIH